MNTPSFAHKTMLTLVLVASLGASSAAKAQSPGLSVTTAAVFDALNARLDETAGGTLPDQSTTSKIVAVLSADQKLKGQIAVFTSGGVVTLSGKMKSVTMIYRAIELTRRVEGVRSVNDDALLAG